jgi:hypothetical protein
MLRRPGQQALMLPNTSSLYGLESVEGYDFPLSKRWSQFETFALGFRGPNAERRLATGPPTPTQLAAMRAMNVGYYLAGPGTEAPAPGMRRIYDGPDGRVYRDPRALPRAYVVPAVRQLPDDRALAALASGQVDPRAQALVPPGVEAPTGTEFAPARVEQVAPDHVRVHLPQGAAGWLVLANAYHPNWTAKVDGKDADLEPTNHAAMGVPVEAGDRTVDFQLDRNGFYAGLAISLAALAAIAALIAMARRRAA